ncbi:MAG TPA: ABC transporter substrate-binding protein [Candidatus Egerieimonas intestinavium]|uniref:ABC transporter substrate-binding protein n=1 Tax=Candidatus Egerieimonas intestinavium TaxID=2840777 RepID=A0A9D1EM90_9FIRM|nr:ABC transporter substrate-binding protein [Candidatus Egerieimonas intestinavium]
MKKRLLSILCALTMVCSLAACGNSSEDTGKAEDKGADSETIRFAVAVPLTGDNAEQGMYVVNGCQMAIDEINAAGGVDGKKFEMVTYDDQASPNQSVTIAEKIVADPSIEFVIAHVNSGCLVAAQDTYISHGISVIGTVLSMDELSDYGWTNFLRMGLCNGDSAKILIDAVMEEETITKPAIFYANNANDLSACNLMVEYLEERYGFTDIPTETFNPETDKDYSAQIDKFKADGIDAVFLSCEYSPAALLAMQSHEKGFEPVFAGISNNNPKFIELGGEDVEGIYTVCGFDSTDEDPDIQEFIKKYEEEYGSLPNDCVSRPYDSIYAIADAYEKGATKDNLAEWMMENTDYEGTTMDFRFDGTCDDQLARTYILRVADGAFECITNKSLDELKAES